MKTIKIAPLFFIIIILNSCEKVIHVDLDTAPARLVIDASVNWIKNTTGNEQRVKLSTSTGYYNPEMPAVSGATVFITAANNTVFSFSETAVPGEYICSNFIPIKNNSYSLTVIVNGETYVATETLIGTPAIEGEIHQNSSGGMTGDEIEIFFSYQDEAAENNYYMTGINGSHIAYPEYILESDEMFQGNKMVQYYSHEDLVNGDSLHIQLYGVSRRFFDYFRKVLLATGTDTGPFPTTPTTVRGNFINQNNPQNYALGYFRLSEVDAKNYVVK